MTQVDLDALKAIAVAESISVAEVIRRKMRGRLAKYKLA